MNTSHVDKSKSDGTGPSAYGTGPLIFKWKRWISTYFSFGFMFQIDPIKCLYVLWAQSLRVSITKYKNITIWDRSQGGSELNN